VRSRGQRQQQRHQADRRAGEKEVSERPRWETFVVTEAGATDRQPALSTVRAAAAEAPR
jgi:hypothetical protein